MSRFSRHNADGVEGENQRMAHLLGVQLRRENHGAMVSIVVVA
jgi:hypothetical protein